MTAKPLLLKIGGSLEGTPLIAMALDHAVTTRRNIVIVPGGGRFADTVRANQNQHHFSDREAHRLAILAMHDMAEVFLQIHHDTRLAFTLDDIESAWSARQNTWKLLLCTQAGVASCRQRRGKKIVCGYGGRFQNV